MAPFWALPHQQEKEIPLGQCSKGIYLDLMHAGGTSRARYSANLKTEFSTSKTQLHQFWRERISAFVHEENFLSPSKGCNRAFWKKMLYFRQCLPLCCWLSNEICSCWGTKRLYLYLYLMYQAGIHGSVPHPVRAPVHNPSHKLWPQLMNFRIKFSPGKLKTALGFLPGHLKISKSGKTAPRLSLSYQENHG